VQKRILPIAITAITFCLLFGWSCTKLDTTNIGSDILPPVDNVNTFDTVLDIISTQGFFPDTSTILGKYDDYALGAINNDPLFGTTNSHIFMQLKPSFYPYYFGDPGDTINTPDVGLDSIVLCLKYRGFWGDSMQPIQLQVREVSENKFRDSVTLLNPTNYQPNTSGTLLGSASVDVRTLGNYIKFTNGRDSVNFQIRIKLSNAWAMQLFNRDSIEMNSVNNAFYSDSIYRRFYNGIGVMATGSGNGLMYISIADTATKLEVHYRKKNNGIYDAVYRSLRLNPSFADVANKPVSNTVNNIIRNYSGFPIMNPGVNEHYLQTSPGSFVNLNIPGLSGLSNRIIHRAELIVEQVPDNPMFDEIFSAPDFLYVELKDTGTTDKWKPIYYDLNTTRAYDPDFKSGLPYWPGDIDYQYFGGFVRNKPTQSKFYNFNISRYVQQIVTDHTYNYDLRLSSPFKISYPQYDFAFLPYGNSIAHGRVKIGSGSNPNYKLRLRIVYSKL
jgi:hypothetical protein